MFSASAVTTSETMQPDQEIFEDWGFSFCCVGQRANQYNEELSTQIPYEVPPGTMFPNDPETAYECAQLLSDQLPMRNCPMIDE